MADKGIDSASTTRRLGEHAEGRPIAPPSDEIGYDVPPDGSFDKPADQPASLVHFSQARAIQSHEIDEADSVLTDETGQTRQFSLIGLLLIFTLASLLLGAATWLPRSWSAGLLGLGALAMLAMISLWECQRAIVHVAWWVVMSLYLGVAIAACLGR
jgi:hypothetical protein